MLHYFYKTDRDSFGDRLPVNWVDIASHLDNALKSALGAAGEEPSEYTPDGREIADNIWERFCAGELPGCPYPVYPSGISFNNGRSYYDTDDIRSTGLDKILSDEHVTWDYIATVMDDEIREQVHRELAPCSNEDFLIRYLELSPDNFIVC